MPQLYDIAGNPLSWEQLEERRQAYYARKAAQEPSRPVFEKRYYGPGTRGYHLVRLS